MVDNIEPCLNPEFPKEQLGKLPCSENLSISSWSYDLESHAKKCVERYCALGKQDDSTTLHKVSINSMHWWPSFQRRLEIRGRVVKSMLSNCSEMLILGTYWKTWYSVVSEQTCKIDEEMDHSLWQTIKSFDILHSLYMWLQNSIVMWVILQNNACWNCFKTPILRRSWWLKHLLQVERCVRFLEVMHLFRYVGCARNKLQFRTIQQNHQYGCRIDVGRYSRTWFFLGSNRRSSWKRLREIKHG